MTSPVQVPPEVRRHRSFDAFAGAHRVVFEQVRAFFPDPGFRMPVLTAVSPDTHDGAPEHALVDGDYYDTAGLDLAADGLAVRWDIPAQEWTAVLPVVSVTGQPIRCQASFPGNADEVPDAVHRLLHLHLHRQPIDKIARLVSRRSTTPLYSFTGIRLANVIDEHVDATRADGERGSYRCVRVEVLDLDGLGRTVLADVGVLLARSGCHVEAPAAELARAFGSPSWSR